MSSADAKRLVCMEVWGGNAPFDNAVTMPGLDAWVYCRPYAQADGGGDVYYASSCATGRITRLLVADVSGHGDAVKAIGSKLRLLMRRNVNHIEQTSFVGAMNREFGELSAEGEGGCFATAVVTTYFAPTNHLSLCNAGHPPPLLYRAATRTWMVLDKEGHDGNVPLGILEGTNYGQFEIELAAGDLVLCYTDSLIESKNESGEMLGTLGLLGAVHSLDIPPAKLIPALLASIEQKHAGNLAGDDVTVMLLAPNMATGRVSFFKKALAPLRVMGAAVRALFPGGQPVPWPEWSRQNLGL